METLFLPGRPLYCKSKLERHVGAPQRAMGLVEPVLSFVEGLNPAMSTFYRPGCARQT